MQSPKIVGRIIGLILLAQMVTSYVVNFVLEAPVFASPPGFLVNAAPNATRLGVAALLGLGLGALSAGNAIAAFPFFRRYSHPMALWYLTLGAVTFSVTTIENVNLLSLLSLSQAYAKASPANPELFQALRVVVSSSRNWAHFTQLIIAGGMILLLYCMLFRFKLVPRILAGLGMPAALLQMTAVAMPLFGHDVVFPMLMPLGLCHLALALWLLAMGFAAGDPLIREPRGTLGVGVAA